MSNLSLPEINGNFVDSRICWTSTLHHLIERNIWLAAIHRSQSETALLQLRLRIIPVLVHNKVLQSGEQTDGAKRHAMIKTFIHIESTQKGFQQIRSILSFELSFGIRVNGVLSHPQVVANDSLSSVIY